MGTPITQEDIGRGEDQFRPETKIREGFWERLRNYDPTLAGTIEKRVGYEGFGGFVPLRVGAIEHSNGAAAPGTQIYLTIDAPALLDPALRSTPIVVYGRLSTAASAALGDFRNDAYFARYYAGFVVDSGRIRVTDTTATAELYTDTAMELNVYGIRSTTDILDPADTTDRERWGWVGHADTFRSATQVRPVCGSGSNLYAAYLADELVLATHGVPAAGGANLRAAIAHPTFSDVAGVFSSTGSDTVNWTAHGLQTGAPVRFATTVTLPAPLVAGTTYYAIFIGANSFRVALSLADAAVGAFVDLTTNGVGTHTATALAGLGLPFVGTGEISVRPAGYIRSTGGSSGTVVARSVAFVSAGVVDVVLDLPSLQIVGPLASILEVNGDRLTLSQMHTSVLNGEFFITAVTAGVNAITVRIRVPAITDTRYNIAQGAGFGAVWTAPVPLGARLRAPLGALLHTAANLSEDDSLVLSTSTPTRVWVARVDGDIIISDTILYARSTLGVVPLRTAAFAASVTGYVRGDSLEVGTERRPRVVSLNPNSDEAVTVSADGITATVAVTSSANFWDGDKILLLESAQFEGPQTIRVASSTTLEFDTALFATAEPATLIGATASLDYPAEFVDDAIDPTSVRPHSRWIPLAYPLLGTTAAQRTLRRYFEYENDAETRFIRSVMAQDSMYFTDFLNPIMKYTGADPTTPGRGLVRAGFPRWQAGFAGGRTVASALMIPGDVAETAITGGTTTRTLAVAAGAAAAFPAGSRAIQGSPTQDYRLLVTGTSTEAAATDVQVDPASSAPSTLYRSTIRKYYLRLNLVDQNNRVTASAATSSADFAVDFGADCSVTLKLLRLPWFEGVDIGRIQAEIYATADGLGSPPFYKIGTAPVVFTNGAGYIHFRDSVSPASLRDAFGRLDPVHSRLKGAEIGTGWDCPPRAKSISYLGGRLALANLRGWPEWDIFAKPAATNAMGSVQSDQLHLLKYTFRKAGAVGIVTNNSTIMTYQFVNGPSATAGTHFSLQSAVQSAAGVFSVLLATVPAGLAVGDWAYLTDIDSNPEDRAESSPELSGLFQVSAISGSRVSFLSAEQRAPLAFAPADVNTATDTITFTSPHGLQTGQVVSFYTSGTLPAPLVADQRRHAIVLSTTAIQVATSQVNAFAGTAIDITTTGAGTHQLQYGALDNDTAVFFATDPTDVPVVLFGRFAGTQVEDALYRCVNTYDTTPFSNESLDATLKAGNIVNASMALLAQTGSFRPWLTAGSGNDWGPDEIFVRSPVSYAGSLPEMVITPVAALNAQVATFVNGVEYLSGTAPSRELRFPSRVAFSYPNYPEIFDNPYAPSELFSDSVVDVSPSDGQEITAVIPVFGDSAFGAASKDGPLLVFKEFSVHVLKPSIETGSDGVVRYSYAQQPLETNGQGCTYPRSVIPTKHGILFANSNGLWKINRSLEIVFLGQIEKRTWLRNRNTEIDTEVVCATHDALRNHAQVSFASVGEETNDRALVYDHTRESGDERGSWTQYDNLPASVWANDGRDSFFGTPDGAVFRRRRANDDTTDYLDDTTAVGGSSGATARYRWMDFGVTAFRKIVRAVELSWRTALARVAPSLTAAVDGSTAFRPCDAANLQEPTSPDGLTTTAATPTQVVTYGIPVRRAQRVQIEITDTAIAAGSELVQMDFVVDPLDERGVTQAADT